MFHGMYDGLLDSLSLLISLLHLSLRSARGSLACERRSSTAGGKFFSHSSSSWVNMYVDPHTERTWRKMEREECTAVELSNADKHSSLMGILVVITKHKCTI